MPHGLGSTAVLKLGLMCLKPSALLSGDPCMGHLMDPLLCSWSCHWEYLGVGLWVLSDKIQRVQLMVMAGDGQKKLYFELTELRPHPDGTRLITCYISWTARCFYPIDKYCCATGFWCLKLMRRKKHDLFFLVLKIFLYISFSINTENTL